MTENGTSEVCFTHVVTSASWLTFQLRTCKDKAVEKR